jgi:hypothetical protein
VTGGETTRPARSANRHPPAAITRNLYTWTNYKNWADQVRDSWSSTEPSTANAGAKPKK